MLENTTASKFIVGDIVRLKVKSPDMVIESVKERKDRDDNFLGYSYTVQWFAGSKPLRQVYNEEVLMSAKVDEKKMHSSSLKPTETDAAYWLKEHAELPFGISQEDAVSGIQEKFGEDFLFENDSGNLAISRVVLQIFRSLTQETVVWDKSERSWRPREQIDMAGRQQE